MREIKFRAWDKDHQEMKYNAEQAYDGCGQLDDVDCFGQLLEAENYEVMQYTGLKDKNGKEIYEGDIVSDGVFNYQIIYSTYGGFLKAINGTTSGMHNNKYLEVIGNIYENLELLEVQND